MAVKLKIWPSTVAYYLYCFKLFN